MDHLLVELAQPRALLAEVDPVGPAVGDRARVKDGHLLGAAAGSELVGVAVPGQAGAQIGEGVRRVAPGEHVEDADEGVLGQVAEVGRAADDLLKIVEAPLLGDGHGDDLLGEDVERVAGEGERLDEAVLHAVGDDGTLEQIAAVLGEDPALADLAHAVAGAADSLQAAVDGAGRLDEDDEIHGAHVDAELEGAGGDDGLDLARLEHLLDLLALIPRHAAVVGADEVGLARLLDEPLGETLAQAAGVDEDDRGLVRVDELEQARVDGGPDAVLDGLADGGRGGGDLFGDRSGLELDALGGAGHVRDGDDDLDVDARGGAGVDDRDVAIASEEAGDLVEGGRGSGQPDPLRLGDAVGSEPLERQGQVGAALGGSQRVDLVHDHGVDGAQRLAGLAEQEEVERLGGGDEDLAGVLDLALAILGRGVAGAHVDAGDPDAVVADFGGAGDADERGPEVALDVVDQRLERGDVEGLHPAGALLVRVSREAIDAIEERGEGLAAAGGGDEQAVLAGRDLLPALVLDRGGLGEGALEPGRGGGTEHEAGQYSRGLLTGFVRRRSESTREGQTCGGGFAGDRGLGGEAQLPSLRSVAVAESCRVEADHHGGHAGDVARLADDHGAGRGEAADRRDARGDEGGEAGGEQGPADLGALPVRRWVVGAKGVGLARGLAAEGEGGEGVGVQGSAAPHEAEARLAGARAVEGDERADV